MPDYCILAGSDLNRGLYSWRQAVLHLDGVLSDHLVQFPVPRQTVFDEHGKQSCRLWWVSVSSIIKIIPLSSVESEVTG